MSQPSSLIPSTRNRQTAICLAMIAVGMVMLAYAAVPLYQLFCQVTGFGGTTQTAGNLPTQAQILTREMTVSFNADVDTQLPWRFKPVQPDITFRIGESMLVAYEAENLTDHPITGMATYNVTPYEAGQYFHKIECFCFSEQTLAPHQKVHMPISFYLDPAINEDPNLKGVKNITLSYTFYNQSNKN